MRNRLIALSVLAGMAMAGCATVAPLPTPTAPPPTLAPDELIKASGAASYASENIRLLAEATVRVEWTQSGEGLFAIWLIYDGEEDLTDPSLNRILIENTTSPSTGVKDFALPPGVWYLEVEEAHGPWTVVVRNAPQP